MKLGSIDQTTAVFKLKVTQPANESPQFTVEMNNLINIPDGGTAELSKTAILCFSYVTDRATCVQQLSRDKSPDLSIFEK